MPTQQQLTPSKSTDHTCFSPAMMVMLQQAVEDAWQDLVRRGDPAAAPGREHAVREILAHSVMSWAARGETDPGRLKDEALMGFSH
jgi:hypothetical protein